MNHNETMWHIFRVLRSHLEGEYFLIALVICWKLWDIRNAEVHGNEAHCPPNLVRWATDFVKMYWEAQRGELVDTATVFRHSWRPPDPGVFKLNVDASFPVAGISFRISMVARDCHGKCIWWYRKEISGRPQPSEGPLPSFMQLRKLVFRSGAVSLLKRIVFPLIIVFRICRVLLFRLEPLLRLV